MKTSHTIYTSFAKRLAIILTLLTLGVTFAWTQEYGTSFTIKSEDVVTNSGYTSYNTTVNSRDWVITYGGNNLSVGTNSSNRNNCKLSSYTKYAVSPVTTSSIASAFVCKTSISDVSKISYTINGGSSQNSTKVYLIYSSNNSTFSQIELTSGQQGAVIATSYEYEFDKCSGYFGLLFQSTNSSGAWRIDNVNITFYKSAAPSTFNVTYNANGATGTVPTDANKYASGAKVTAKSHGNLVKEGFSFAGWKRSDDSSIVQENTTFNMPASNLTLTAQWAAKALTNYRTSCTEPCEQLGVATGLSVQTDYVDNGQTYVKFSWTPADNTKSHATKQVICIGKVGEEKKCTDLEGNQVWSGDLRSKLTPGEYEWTIQAIGDGETYCDGEVISGPNFTIEEPLTDNCRWVEIALEDITPEDEIVVTMGNDEIGYALGTEKITNSPKSQAITITSGMIDINQDFDYSKYTWSISAVTGGYTLQPYGSDQYLYGVASYITISSTPTTFSIFEDSENGNKCFAYLINYKSYFLGHGIENEQTAWKRFESFSFLSSNTLKFYKKTCLPANKFWIDYELANVTCTNTPPPFAN